MTLGGVPIIRGEVAGSFAKYLRDKVELNVSKTRLDPTIYKLIKFSGYLFGFLDERVSRV